ncbi:ROK family protein [[Eubacterium] cellulosolvens]
MTEKILPPTTVGVDLGGTKVATAILDREGHILSSHKYPTDSEKGSDSVVEDLVGCITERLRKDEYDPKALGIGVAGQIDVDGVVRSAPNLNWRDVPLKTKLEEKLGLPVIVTNDVRAATLGEWEYGSGKNINDLVLLFVGTGIGGGVITNGRLLTGCSNIAGELGHITIVVEGRKCHCPKRGCMEAYGGGWAIAERAQEAVRNDSSAGKALLEIAVNAEQITAATVSKAYHNGDKLASNLVIETSRYIAAGVSSIVNAFNPCLIVLGGGVIEGIPELIQMIEEQTKKEALKPAIENLRFTKASLGGKAGVVGAAALAQHKINGTIS